MRKALQKFQHILVGGKENSPHICAPNQYGYKIQYADPLDAAEYLYNKETNPIQQVCGTFLYYAIAIDNTIIPALSDISSDHSKATKNTAKKVAKLPDYLDSNPNAEIQYRACGIQLAIHSNASYLSVSQYRHRDSGGPFSQWRSTWPKNPENFVPTVNDIILVVWKIMRNIMASAPGAEYGTIFIDAQTDVPICTTLNEMGWKQGPTAIQFDNSTAVSISTKAFREKI